MKKIIFCLVLLLPMGSLYANNEEDKKPTREVPQDPKPFDYPIITDDDYPFLEMDDFEDLKKD